MVAVFVDAEEAMAQEFERHFQDKDPSVRIHRDPEIAPEALPALLANSPHRHHRPHPVAHAGGEAVQDAAACGVPRYRRTQYMNPEELAELGITVHTIKGYGDTAVAEATIALMWAAARDIALMDREMRTGQWLREDGMQLTGKTLGLIGFGGIAAEVARIAHGGGHEGAGLEPDPEGEGARRHLRRAGHAVG